MAARAISGVAQQRAFRELDPKRVEKLNTFFVRASVASRLLHSRLALPIAYPLNTAMWAAVEGKQGDWKQNEIQRGLAHVTPIVSGMAKMAPLLKATQALGYYQGPRQRHVAPDPEKQRQTEDDVRLDMIRPERFRGRNYGRGVGHVFTKIGRGIGWDDLGSGRAVDSPLRRMVVDPHEDTPRLHETLGNKYESPTKWDKRKSGSQ
eukprot:TRINITY_DN55338_c0_g1_i1.p1 TRINITY_DN55338_c0_g1~~TRINITY_DN55338_c0_g1_i1.p1  ORF type:complete len:206 (+),score=29.30 TRINITY_DN55338_c0_g1_i1:124-741(+)